MSTLWDNFSWPLLGSRLLALAVAITIHEFAHAWVAYLSGDDTAKRMGRMSLNPIDHLDLLGAILMVCVGFGWAKPVPVNPNMFRSPRRDNFLVGAAGPAANLLLVLLLGGFIRLGVLGLSDSNIIGIVIMNMLYLNVGLAFFNMIPIPPLDGSRMLMSILPFEQARIYDRNMTRYGFIILLGLVFIFPNLLGHIISVPATLFLRLATGF